MQITGSAASLNSFVEWTENKVFPVIFPVNREMEPGDGFAADCKHRHVPSLWTNCGNAPTTLKKASQTGGFLRTHLPLVGSELERTRTQPLFWAFSPFTTFVVRFSNARCRILGA